VTEQRRLRLGTRRSRLALAQSQLVAAQLTAATGHAVELVEITTEGDVSREHLTQIGGTGVFVSALREALLADQIDLAVHSLKDLPTGDADGLALAAVPAREDPRDVLVARDGLTLDQLPAGSVIGTGSPRRAAQLRALGFGLEVRPVRGNVDTRLRLVSDGKVDGVVLARAGLARLGQLGKVTQVIDPHLMLPAPGQGALAVETRADSPLVAELAAALDDPEARAAVLAERTLLAMLEAGCTAPVGALAEVVPHPSPHLSLHAVVAADDGSATIRKSATGPLVEAQELGRNLAAELLDEDAAGLVTAPAPGPHKEAVS
jgi:hydroxymethylbilane synthase